MFKGKIIGGKFFLVSALFPLVFLSSCSDDSEKQKLLLEALNENIEKSGIMFNKSTETIFQSLEDKLIDPATKTKAEIWYPKAATIRNLTKKIFRDIENGKKSVKTERVFTKAKAAELYASLKKYKNDLLKIDPEITNAFDSSFILITPQFKYNRGYF